MILGQPKPGGKSFPERLPTVVDLFPEILDESNPETDDGPSCSLAEALDHQELFINQAMATFGLDLLWKMFRHGKVDHHGVFVNLSAGRTSPLPVDKEVWKRFGTISAEGMGRISRKTERRPLEEEDSVSDEISKNNKINLDNIAAVCDRLK